MKKKREFLAQTRNENVFIFVVGLIFVYLANTDSVVFGMLGLGGLLAILAGATGFFWKKTNKREKKPLSWIYIILLGNLILALLGFLSIALINPAQYL